MSEYTGSLYISSYLYGFSDPRGDFFSSYSHTTGSLNSRQGFNSQFDYLNQSYFNVNIIFRMRAFNTILNNYVYWYVRQNPDLNGISSGYPPQHLQDIVIQNRRFI